MSENGHNSILSLQGLEVYYKTSGRGVLSTVLGDALRTIRRRDLSNRHLTVSASVAGQTVKAVDGVSFDIKKGASGVCSLSRSKIDWC